VNGPRRRDPKLSRLSDLAGGHELRAAAIVFVLLSIAVWALAILGGIELLSALFGTD
jgi:hypothetical protein